jgi:3-isopropylmalate dehydratase small subunit
LKASIFFSTKPITKVIQDHKKQYDNLSVDFKQKTLKLQTQQKQFTTQLGTLMNDLDDTKVQLAKAKQRVVNNWKN